MPWKECSVMDERLQFVARRLAGEPPPEGSIYFIGVTTDGLDHYFHLMPVNYFGQTDRTDKWVISWRCQRNSASLTCKALD